jgi:hypothetical protein
MKLSYNSINDFKIKGLVDIFKDLTRVNNLDLNLK